MCDSNIKVSVIPYSPWMTKVDFWESGGGEFYFNKLWVHQPLLLLDYGFFFFFFKQCLQSGIYHSIIAVILRTKIAYNHFHHTLHFFFFLVDKFPLFYFIKFLRNDFCVLLTTKMFQLC